MRTVTVEYCCVICPSGRVSLRLEGWHVEYYPLTFTVQECLEDWCETVGWRYISHRGVMSMNNRAREYYMFTIELSMYESTTSTINNHVRGRNED